jgi:hypothetical protein
MTSDQVVQWTAGTIAVAHLSGELDLGNAGACFDAVKAQLDGASVVVVDLSAVTFIHLEVSRDAVTHRRNAGSCRGLGRRLPLHPHRRVTPATRRPAAAPAAPGSSWVRGTSGRA